jgi:hypothetical protein
MAATMISWEGRAATRRRRPTEEHLVTCLGGSRRHLGACRRQARARRSLCQFTPELEMRRTLDMRGQFTPPQRQRGKRVILLHPWCALITEKR